MRPKEIFVREPVSEEILGLIAQGLEQGLLTEEAVVYVSDSVFEKLSEERAPEGVITVLDFLGELHRVDDAELPDPCEKILILESVRDPGNLGTIMRSCAALGIDRLVLSSDCAERYNPKTVRSAMGALFRLPTLEVSAEHLPVWIEHLRKTGRRVYATALRRDAVLVGSFSMRAEDCFVIGNEGHGLSEAVIGACDGCALIPMREGNESLNAAAAASICIWETVRPSGTN